MEETCYFQPVENFGQYIVFNTRTKKYKFSKSIKHNVILTVVPFKGRLMQQLHKYCFLTRNKIT